MSTCSSQAKGLRAYSHQTSESSHERYISVTGYDLNVIYCRVTGYDLNVIYCSDQIEEILH